MKTKFLRYITAGALSLCALGSIAHASSPPPATAPQTQPVDTQAKAKEAKAAKDLPRVRILATGGTIAGAQNDQSAYGYDSAAFKVEDLIAAVPKMDKLANISGEQVADIGSQDMNDQVWLKLAKRINALEKMQGVDAIVITHGTDTMEETAYFLNLVVKGDKPVVLVGSMRPATAVSADGPANLYNAVATAADPGSKGRGVLVVMNDQIYAARDVKKMNTTSVDTFASPERGMQGLINSGKISWFEKTNKPHTGDTEFTVEKLDALPRVDIIYAYSNMPPDAIAAAVAHGAKGVVIAGVGDGNMNKQSLAELEKLKKEKGLLVIRSTRLPTGEVLRNNEVNDDKEGFVASGEFNPGKSRVLAQLALTETNDPNKVQKMFNTY